jgi:DNA polymerase III delta prime subunit
MQFTQSFLVVALSRNLATSYVSNLLKEKDIDPLDINLQIYEKAMGIEDVRNIQGQILLKPFRGKVKAVILDVYENITPEAQNALLKILEEPPANTIIIITTARKELILPTIISRCKVIALQEKETELARSELSKFQDDLNILLKGKTGDRLKIAETIAKNKEDVVLWLEKMAIFIKTRLTKENYDLKYLDFLKELQKTYKIIKSTNVSQRVALENLFCHSGLLSAKIRG